MKTIRTINR